jgi:hypothetical protein
MDTNQETTLVTKEDLKGLTKRDIRDKEKKESVKREDIAGAIEAGYDYTDQQVGQVAKEVEQLRQQLADRPSEGDEEPTIPEAYTDEKARNANAEALKSLQDQLDQIQQGLASPQALQIDPENRTALVPQGSTYTTQEIK